MCIISLYFFFSSRRRHTRWPRDWSSDVCSSDLGLIFHNKMPKLTGVIKLAQKKKKGRKRSRRYKNQIKFELLGLLFIFLAIFGSGAGAISDGVIPSGLENIFRFFLGIWYFIASVALLFIGIVLLIKRRYPDFKSKKMVGFYIGFLGVLLLTHIQTFERLLLIVTEPSKIGRANV